MTSHCKHAALSHHLCCVHRHFSNFAAVSPICLCAFTYMVVVLVLWCLSTPSLSLPLSVRAHLAWLCSQHRPPFPVLSSVADSHAVLEEAGPGAAYLYGPCALRACRADRKALQQNTLCVLSHTYTQIILVHLLFLSWGDVAVLRESFPVVPWQGLTGCAFVNYSQQVSMLRIAGGMNSAGPCG